MVGREILTLVRKAMIASVPLRKVLRLRQMQVGV